LSGRVRLLGLFGSGTRLDMDLSYYNTLFIHCL
jgi:hypothetical protein